MARTLASACYGAPVRRILTALCLLAVFAGAALLGYATATRLGPRYLQAAVERGLSDLLRTEVRVARTHLRLGKPGSRLRLEGQDARAWPGPRGAGVTVRTLRATIDPLAWLRGQRVLREVVLEGVEALPPALAQPRGDDARPASGAEDPLVRSVHRLDDLGRWLETHLCDLSHLVVQGGRIAGPEAGDPPLLEDLQGSIVCRGSRAELDLAGRRPTAQGEGRLVLRAQALPGRVDAELTLSEVDVAPLTRWLEPVRAGGLATGRLAWKTERGGPQQLSLALRGPSLWVSFPRPGADPLRLRSPDAALRVELSASPRELRLTLGEWKDRELRLHVEGEVALPLAKSSELRLALRTDRIDLGMARRRVAELPASIRSPVELLLERLEAGRLEELRIEARTTISDWSELVEGRILGRTGTLDLAVRLADATVRVGSSDRMRHVRGELRFGGDTVAVIDLRAEHEGVELPRMDLRVEGLSQIGSREELRCVTPRDVPGLPGISELQAWIRSRRQEAEGPSWQALRVEADWLAHPALLCVAEQLVGEITPGERGSRLRIKRGVWAGMPIRADVELREGSDGGWQGGQVLVSLQVGPPFEPMQPVAPRDVWARGRFRIRATRLGTWSIRGAEGGFEARAARLRLEPLALRLTPSSEVRGWLELALGRAGALRYDAAVGLEGISIEDLWRASGHTDRVLRGWRRPRRRAPRAGKAPVGGGHRRAQPAGSRRRALPPAPRIARHHGGQRSMEPLRRPRPRALPRHRPGGWDRGRKGDHRDAHRNGPHLPDGRFGYALGRGSS